MAAKKKKRKSGKRKKAAAAPVAKTAKKKSRKKGGRKKKSKGLSAAALAATMAAFSGESKQAREDKKIAEAAIRAFSGESRHGEKAEAERLHRLMTIWAGADRRKRAKNPRIARRQFPSKYKHAGRPAKGYWRLDVYKGRNVTTYWGFSNKTVAERDAYRKLLKTRASKVALSGPFKNKPAAYMK